MLTHPQQDRCQEKRKKERENKKGKRKEKKEKEKKKKRTITGGVNLNCDDDGGKQSRRAVC